MNDLLITDARLIDPEEPDERRGWLAVADGRIVAHGAGAAEGQTAKRLIHADGKCLAPGIVDLGVKVGEPGERHKESFGTA
ncbi:MAG: dihydroorotase, partial [Pseudomonadota bacterium]